MRRLDSILASLFDHSVCTRRGGVSTIKERSVLIEIQDTDSSVVEVPLFALHEIVHHYDKKPDAWIYNISVDDGNMPMFNNYQTLDGNMRNALTRRHVYEIAGIYANPKDTSSGLYYYTQGAIFDKNLDPVFICSWKLGKKINPVGNTEYEFIQPIIRVSPQIVINKDDAMKRYVINSILSKAAESSIWVDGSLQYIQIIVDDYPFIFYKTKAPTVLVGKKELMHTIKEYTENSMNI